MSETPVILPSPLAVEVIKPASTGSVTAAKMTGASVIAWARAWAVGVAIPTARSTFSDLNFWAMEEAVDISPLAFCKSNSVSGHSAFTISTIPSSRASRAGWATIFEIPILRGSAAVVFSAVSVASAVSFLPHPVIKATEIITAKAIINNFLLIFPSFIVFFYIETLSLPCRKVNNNNTYLTPENQQRIRGIHNVGFIMPVSFI